MDNEQQNNKKYKVGFSSTKEGGYLTQNAYKANHPDRVRKQKREEKRRERKRIYEPKIRMPIENKVILTNLLDTTGLSISELCLGAVEEKYGVTLLKKLDNNSD